MRLAPVRTLPLRVRLNATDMVNRWVVRTQHLRARGRAVGPAAGDQGGSLSVRIHPYPQLGHQVASWISGFLWARDLDLQYLGGSLSHDTAGLFNFGAITPTSTATRRVNLPATYDERDPTSLSILRSAIYRAHRRYPGESIDFRLSLDQARWDQVPASSALRRAVELGALGERLRAASLKDPYIAVHVRRGDVTASTHPDRWVAVDWHASVISHLRSLDSPVGSLPIKVFALGEARDFSDLEAIPGVQLRLNGDRDSDFIELCAAKVLVVAPSSFSFSAGMVGQGVILARHPWWHEVPGSGRWVRVDGEGYFAPAEFDRALKHEDP